LGFAVIKDECHLVRGKVKIHWCHRHAQFGHALEDFDVLDAVAEEHGDPVALGEPEFRQSIRKAVGPSVEFPPCPTVSTADDCRPPASVKGVPTKHATHGGVVDAVDAQVGHHCPSSISIKPAA
jgi:hypothetical protein